MAITITDVRIKKYDNTDTKIKAVASVTIDESFVVHDIKVIDSVNGLFITMPSKKGADGAYRDVAHPINSETRKLIQDAVLTEYNK